MDLYKPDDHQACGAALLGLLSLATIDVRALGGQRIAIVAGARKLLVELVGQPRMRAPDSRARTVLATYQHLRWQWYAPSATQSRRSAWAIFAGDARRAGSASRKRHPWTPFSQSRSARAGHWRPSAVFAGEAHGGVALSQHAA